MYEQLTTFALLWPTPGAERNTNSPLTRTFRGTKTAFESMSWNAGTEDANAFGFKTTVREPSDPQSSTRMRPVSGSALADANGMSIRTPVDTTVGNSRVRTLLSIRPLPDDRFSGGVLRQAAATTQRCAEASRGTGPSERIHGLIWHRSVPSSRGRRGHRGCLKSGLLEPVSGASGTRTPFALDIPRRGI